MQTWISITLDKHLAGRSSAFGERAVDHAALQFERDARVDLAVVHGEGLDRPERRKGDVVCGLLEAFKTRTIHYDQDKKRFSMKESSTARDSGSVENIIKSLIAARWPPHARNVA